MVPNGSVLGHDGRVSGPDDYKEPSYRGAIIVAVGSLLVIALLLLALSNLLQQCDPGECPGDDLPSPAALVVR